MKRCAGSDPCEYEMNKISGHYNTGGASKGEAQIAQKNSLPQITIQIISTKMVLPSFVWMRSTRVVELCDLDEG